MEIKSYLLGKKAGGGGGTITLQDKDITITSNGSTTVTKDSGYDGLGRVGITTNVQPNLESKSITITENGTTTVTPATGKDGLSSVSVTANVSGGDVGEYFYDSIGSGTSQADLKEIIKKIPALTIETTNCSYLFSNYKGLSIGTLTFSRKPTNTNNMFNSCTNLLEIPSFDTSSVTNAYNMFSGCHSITTIPNFDFSNATSVYNMFSACSNLTTLPNLNYPKASSLIGMFSSCSKLVTAPTLIAPNATNISNMFSNCYVLENIPVYDWTNVTNASSFVLNCSNLTDSSLDNILQMCISATNYAQSKTLGALGLSSTTYPTSRIQALPHYQDFINAGWTIS